MSEGDRFSTNYAGVGGQVYVDFEPTSHTYGIGPSPEDLQAVPSVSELTEFLPKYLADWAQNRGIIGLAALLERAVRERRDDGTAVVDLSGLPLDDPKFLLERIKAARLDHNSIKESAADRGTAVHSAFRGFILHGAMPDPRDYATGEAKGYIESLRLFCEAIKDKHEPILCEEPLCSPELGVAGTPDLYAEIRGASLQYGGTYGKRPKYEVKSGRFLVDLKTSAQVYLSHTWQLSFYQRMLRECGFDAPDRRAVVLIKPMGGGYNWKEQKPRPEDALAALVRVWEAENRPEGWVPWKDPSNWIPQEV